MLDKLYNDFINNHITTSKNNRKSVSILFIEKEFNKINNHKNTLSILLQVLKNNYFNVQGSRIYGYEYA